MKPMKSTKHQHMFAKDSKAEENSRHIHMTKVDLYDENKSIIEIQKEVKHEEKYILNQNRVYSLRNLRTKKLLVCCEEVSDFSEDFSEKADVKTTIVPIKMTIKKELEDVLTKRNKIKSEMNWKIDKSCMRKAKEDIWSPINKKSNKYQINNLENFDIVKIEKPFISSVSPSKLKPNLPVMLQEKKITSTPQLLVNNTRKSNDVHQNESKITQTLSHLKIFDEDISVVCVKNQIKTKINQYTNMNAKKMKNVQNQREENIGGQTATKQIIGGKSDTKENIGSEPATKEKTGAKIAVTWNIGAKAAATKEKADGEIAVKEKSKWKDIYDKWNDYKWDPRKEPLPHFFNPEMELTDLLECWNDKYLHTTFLKELDGYYVPPIARPNSSNSYKKI